MEQSGLLSELNPDALSEKMEELFPQFTIDFSGFLSRLLAGEMKEAFSLLFSSLKGGVAAEAAGMRNLFLTLLMIGVLSSLFTVAAQAFKNRQTADIAQQGQGTVTASLAYGVSSGCTGITIHVNNPQLDTPVAIEASVS